MPVLLKASMKRAYAESMISDMASGKNQYFLFVAKSTSWGGSDTTPVVPIDTDKTEYDTMRSIIGYKKLDPSKTIFALERIPWELNTRYDAYTDAENLFDEDSPKIFYVVTDENNIYKCIEAPVLGVSTVKPIHTTSIPVRGVDGYSWKYISTIKESLIPYELVDYIPVSFATDQQDTENTTQFNTQRQALDGELSRLDLITNGGASAAVYMGSEYGQKFIVGATGSTGSSALFGIGNVYGIQSSTNSNKFSLPQAEINTYVGNIIRIVGVSGGDPNDVNKYGIILGVTASSDSYTFTIRGEYKEFVLGNLNGSDASVSYDILPYAKVSGDGTGAYALVETGLEGTSDYRKVTEIALIDGGSNYTQARVDVVSSKESVDTVSPTITAVLSPKGGHGSNILKELNVKDIVIISDLNIQDEDKILPGGSYRVFGVIKNPKLNDETGLFAGTETKYFRDLELQYVGTDASIASTISTKFFNGASNNFITGTESFVTFPFSAIKTAPHVVNGETRTTITVNHTKGDPITWADRLDNYEINLVLPQSGFVVGEKVQQIIPAGISAFGGVTYGFSITAEGTVIKNSTPYRQLGVRVTSNAFARGLTLQGISSGFTASVSGVSLAYGEYMIVNSGLSLATEGVTVNLFKMISASSPYFTDVSVPAYRGTTILKMTKKAAQASFSSTTWKPQDFIEQGVSGSYANDYACGTVYNWVYSSANTGNLHITETFGKFRQSGIDGVTLSQINGLIGTGTSNTGYIVSEILPPEIDLHSGEIVYINSMKPIQRLQNQSEEFRLRLGF